MAIILQKKGGGNPGYVRDGYSSRFNENVNVATSTEALDQIFEFTSVNPVASISASPSFGLREFGDDVVNPIITGSATTGQNPTGVLTLLEFLRGSTDIGTETNPTPSTNYQKTDTFTVASNQTYTTKITDDQTRTDTANGSYSFTYPFYTGLVNSGDLFDGITQAQILALGDTNKIVKTKSNTNVTTSPVAQRFMIGYPASYGSLSSVIDNSGFETISDYDVFTYGVVGLDGTNQSYKFYVLKNDTTQTSFINQYKF